MSVWIYIFVSFGIFILAIFNFVFTKLLDRLYGNFNALDVEYIFGWTVLFIFGFGIYLWAVDIRGIITKMLGQTEDTKSAHLEKPKEIENQSEHRSEITEILISIRDVDKNFKDNYSLVRLLFLLELSPLLIVGLGFLWFARYFANLAAEAATAPGLLDTSVNILAVAIASAAVGVPVLIVMYTVSFDRQRARVEERFHLWNLKRMGKKDTVTLRALIRMRSKLPKGITLEQVYEKNNGLFTESELAKALLKN